MPRDGSGIYTQPDPDVSPDTTIESAVYNNFVADVATDLNTPRPVIAGGTGSNNALDAMETLGGEIAEQLIVNYNDFPFQTGSFRSAGSATGGPVDGHAFVGIVYKSDDANLVLEARDQNDTAEPGTKYVREKKAGVWGAWASEDADTAAAIAALDAAKVNRVGDTMTGNLTLDAADISLVLTKGAAGGNNIYGFTKVAGVPKARWLMILGNPTAESGGNAGSDFYLYRYADDGSDLGAALNIERKTGITNFMATPQAPTPPQLDNTTKLANTAFVTAAAATKVSKAGDTMTGDLTIYRAAGAPTTGAIYFGNTGLKYLYYDGVGWNLVGGYLIVDGPITAGLGGFRVAQTATAGSTIYQVLVEGNPSWGVMNMQTVHVAGAWAGFRFAISAGPFFEFRNDGIGYNAGGGMWGSNSDARIKNVTGEYTSGLAEICALKPMRYKYKGNETDDEPSHWPAAATEEEKAKNPAPNEDPTAPYKNSPHYGSVRDDIEYIGLLAQDAEVPMPELVSKQKGYIDGTAVDDLRMMNATPVIYALVNAVKELKAEIDTLKAALATKEAR